MGWESMEIRGLLTLIDKRLYNALLQNAWAEIDQDTKHWMTREQLDRLPITGDRLQTAIERLIGTIVVLDYRCGERGVETRVPLLGEVSQGGKDGMLSYSFPERLRVLIRDDAVFPWLQRQVIFAFKSKYALPLYESVHKRHNQGACSGDFSLQEIRDELRVPNGELDCWTNLYDRAIHPAVSQIHELSDFRVAAEPIRIGHAVVGVRLRWWPKHEPTLALRYR